MRKVRLNLIGVASVLFVFGAAFTGDAAEESRLKIASTTSPVEVAPATVFDFEDGVAGWGYTERVKGRQATVSEEKASSGKASLKFEATFPGHAEVSVPLERANWSAHGEVSVNLFIPADAPKTTQVLVFVKDRDHLWYQHVPKEYLRVGAWNHVRIPLTAAGNAWEFRGHFKPWADTSRLALLELGVRVFCKDEQAKFSGAVYLDEVKLHPLRAAEKQNARTTRDGFIRQLRVNAKQVGQYEKFEITFELPKEYANPFDPEQIAVDATFITPTGKEVSVPGFFYQEFMRENGEGVEKFTPLGNPVWKVRFAPTEVGRYYWRVTARDATTVAETAQHSFVSEKSDNRGFVRVWEPKEKEVTRRYFEFSNGEFFFPIGHNIRSPFDVRYAQAAWANLQPRADLGSRAYDRYFKKMGEHGENFCEVWMASWWLALEWKSNAPGYHGVGEFNTLHAWKLDRMMERAKENGIYVLLVLNNHGKFSTWVDQEWASNPYNKINGGPFESPDEFFTDPRGRTSFKNQLRYLVARWGYDTQVFGWKLFSEINLTGSGREFHRTAAMREWHREMGGYLSAIDPWKHPVTTHYSSDYRVQDPRLVSLPELDFNTVDAYHGANNALRIIELINETTQFNRQFNKPVIITEFGGSAGGTRARVLRTELHNALWTSACSPIASTPLLWWWIFIDENNLYTEFRAVANFMKGEDRRVENLELAADAVELFGNEADRIGVQALAGGTRAYVWLYDRDWLATQLDDADARKREDLKLRFHAARADNYRVEFWETVGGTVIAEKVVESADGTVDVDVPPFHKDIAVKIKPVQNPPTR